MSENMLDVESQARALDLLTRTLDYLRYTTAQEFRTGSDASLREEIADYLGVDLDA